MSQEFIISDGCGQRLMLEMAGTFVTAARISLSEQQPLIDEALEVVREADREPANPVIDQTVAWVIDSAAGTSRSINAIDIDEVEAVETILTDPPCSEESRLLCTTGCPKFERLLPHMEKILGQLS